MDKQQEAYFNALSANRTDSAKALEGFALRGVKNSMVEKYSDQAHFIYELLQNADDAKATTARFELHEDKLIFAHNGTRRFTVSNPATEEQDQKNGSLGDINAITAIGNSNKTDQVTIGKFGVGFKAVFQYTSTPQIYDPGVSFRIERFIVPTKIFTDYTGRKKNETLFVFTFDHTERTPKEAFLDISYKLRSLDYPLLFLSNLKDISFDIHGILGLYGKSVEQKRQFGNTVAEFVCLTQNDGDDFHDYKLWLFSRDDDNGNAYKVGFFVDEKGNLTATSHSAICFFPTKESTGLNFIVHAPFLLTDSRESIRAGVQHNKNMIEALANLAADSLVYLKDLNQLNCCPLINDSIFEIIPYDEKMFGDVNDNRKISFKPFYTAILEKMSNEDLLPASSGFVSKQDACWAFVPQIAELFSDEQLEALCENKNTKWVFTSLGRQDTLRKDKSLTNYIDSITKVRLNEEDILDGRNMKNGEKFSGISAEFIESQSIEWLHSFYKWVFETTNRTKIVKKKPIFLNQDNKAVAAFDERGQAILFLPIEGVIGYETVSTALLENKETAEFIKQIGITAPSLRDEIYNKIIPQYEDGVEIDTDPHFRKFFKYYKECPRTEVDGYIELIKNCEFISYRSAKDETMYRGKANELYMPNNDLVEYFAPKPDTRFVALDEYTLLVNEKDNSFIETFLIALGVRKEPAIIERELSEREAYQLKPSWEWAQPTYHNKETRKWTDRYLDGCEELLNNVTFENTITLWDILLKLISKPTDEQQYLNRWSAFDTAMNGEYEYFFRFLQSNYFDSTEANRLRTKPWLLNIDDEFAPAKVSTLQTLSPKYNIKSKEAKVLLRFLGILKDEDNNITDEQRAKIEFADAYSDIPPEVLLRVAKEYRARKRMLNSQADDEDSSIDVSISREAREITKPATSAAKDKIQSISDEKEKTSVADEDDFIKPSIDFSKKIEQAKQRSANEIENIAYVEELTQQSLNSGKYTFGWFKALLKLEVLNSGENNANSKEIFITFSKVEREEGTSRTLILRHPSRYIPQHIEDLADIPLELHFNDQPMIKVAIEVVNVKSYTLRIKLKTNAQIDGIDLSLITEAIIKAKNPVFLLNELQKQFNSLDFDDDYNLQSNLCDNIEFVFGPPGTGKTTYLAEKIILTIMRKQENLKVLVLTPTNKAADVLVRRLMDSMGSDKSYLDWLVRFGTTNDSAIEESGVFRDKTFDIRSFSRNVIVTTIARFPYDYFLPDESTRLHLSALKWDYIIIDEASMIPLVNIAFLLYKKTPEKFIIAGDPFQIEPITTVSIWKDENIYTMVELKSFTEPKTIPHPYHVELLTTQYRSIPNIGEVFSQFAYGGVLHHSRTEDSQRPLLIEGVLEIKPLNIIKFPVSKYESIYRPKRLQSKSNYHIYSALFTFEFVKYLSNLIKLKIKDELFRIGVIAPYRAQSDLMDKLMSNVTLPKNIDVQVGTIHGFQGDECDIVIALFNPPPYITTSQEMFLNKLNIINVSISRARDYLFVIMPDDDTENIGNLTLIKKIEKLCKEQPNWIEWQAPSIEELIFGSKTYLEDNSFSTSHQLVNVYGKPEKRYEVRSEDSAIDVQIHE